MTAALAVLASLVAFAVEPEPKPLAELDPFWSEAVRTVEEGDFDGYAKLYHPDAVLVNDITGETYPIAKALSGWKPGFVDTKAGKATASLEFRFTQRLHDGTTAHETGYFRYDGHPVGEPAAPKIVKFEALLVRKNGRWLWLMERQQKTATEAEWNAAGAKPRD